MYEYDTMEVIDTACAKFTSAGLYVFAYRYTKPGDIRNWYSLQYIGETENFSKRDYNNHHKKNEIVAAKCKYGVITRLFVVKRIESIWKAI